ncbi:type II secretion system F family protein, partial [Komagataeibacter kakiaceti]|uniref:type II secretion system F family protein n=1 Tax=Komagataeibacter kakiaceti TaxID=943261 RepID=UPI0038996D78
MMERERALVATIQSAMIYPAMLMLAAIGSVVLLLTQVLPQFVPLFAENNATLPRSTRMLIAMGNWLEHDGPPLLGGVVCMVVLARFLLKRRGPRLWADRMWLRLPVMGTLAREITAAHFTRTLGTLLMNGVPLLAALAIVHDVIGNHAVRQAVGRATDTA